ncbi:MAG: inositol monophosphatase family protein [Candidatus Nanopelagicales bacterium]|nr:inositol monophosphatase family protein [Candidatus Nanopelagicales bacterium]
MSARQRLVAGLLDRARTVAHSAATMLVDDRPTELAVESKTVVTDIVTDMDRRSEVMIVDRLLEGRSGDGVLGEEGDDHAGESGVRWVIDPIDGTVNYLYRLPIWAVCIGAEIDGEPAVGVVAVPELGCTYFGAVGMGAWVSGAKPESVDVILSFAAGE